MIASQLIDILKRKRFLADRTIEKLRNQLGEKCETMSADRLAELLVNKGRITSDQAKQALDACRRTPVRPSDAASRDDEASESFIGFAPLDEDDRASDVDRSAVPSGEAALDRPGQEDVVILSPADDSRHSTDDQEDFGLLTEDDVIKPPSTHAAGAPSSLVEEEWLSESAPTEGGPLETGSRGWFAFLRRQRKTKRSIRDPERSEWESPLILLGGGGLLLLLLVATIVWYLLIRDTGDELFELASDQFTSGSYTQSIDSYQRFLDSFPNHAKASDANVQLGVARIRKATEGTADFANALDVARAEIVRIENEERFSEAHGELAALLERIVVGLAEQATSTTDPAIVTARLEQTEEALRLINNTKYVPKSQRPVESIQDVRQMLALVKRRNDRDRQLAKATSEIADATAAGRIGEAYAAYCAILSEQPGFASDESLLSAVAKVASAAKNQTTFRESKRVATAAPIRKPVVGSVALAGRFGPTAAQNAGAPPDADNRLFFRIDGAVYAINAADGELLWRRYVGFDQQSRPLSVGGDAIVFDSANHSLLRLDGTSGQVRWALDVGESALAPVRAQGSILLTLPTGKIWQVDLETGAAAGYFEIPQRIAVPPLALEGAGQLLVVAEHSSVYLLDIRARACSAVFHLGHRRSSISIGAVDVAGSVVLAENLGENTARLHLLSVGRNGIRSRRTESVRLEGHVTTPFAVEGRRLAIATDMGELRAFDIAPSASGKATIVPAATRPASGRSEQRFVLLHNGRLWLAGKSLSPFRVLPTGNRFHRPEMPEQFVGDAVDQPIVSRGDRIVLVRRLSDFEGAVVAAVDAGSGNIAWQTRLAAPLADRPIVYHERREIVVATRAGGIFMVDADSIRAGNANGQLGAAAFGQSLPIANSLGMASGSAVFSGPRRIGGLLSLRPTDSGYELSVVPLPDAMACRPLPLGGGIICPTKIGQIFLIDPLSGESLASPFQPPIAPDRLIEWTEPSAVAGGSRFVVADRNGKLLLIEIESGGSPRLRSVAEAGPFDATIVAPPAVADETVFVGTADAHLRAFSLPKLDPAETISLDAPLSWGPYSIGEFAVAASDSGSIALAGAGGKLVWMTKPSKAMPIGRPLRLGEHIAVATASGGVLRLSIADGKVTDRFEMGQALSEGPIPFGGRWLVPAYDGTLLFVDRPDSW